MVRMVPGLMVVIISLTLASCGSQPMGVLALPTAPKSPDHCATAEAVLQKMRTACWFCPASVPTLTQCLLITKSNRATAKLMHLADLVPNLQPPVLPASWNARPDTLVWVAAIAGSIQVPYRQDVAWAVFVLPHDAGFTPQVAVLGPFVDVVGHADWPAFYDALPDLSTAP